MDSEQFEDLVVRLQRAATRREAVKSLVGGVIVSVGAATVASSSGRAQNRCKKNGKNCVEAQTLQYTATSERRGGRRRRRRGD